MGLFDRSKVRILCYAMTLFYFFRIPFHSKKIGFILPSVEGRQLQMYHAQPVWSHSAVGQNDIITCTIPIHYSLRGCYYLKLFVVTVISDVGSERRVIVVHVSAMRSLVYGYRKLLLKIFLILLQCLCLDEAE